MEAKELGTRADGESRRVVALAPMPPEPAAYALARYSRSPDTIEDSVRWVWAHASERFWERFYFAYGHASIADLGHVTMCFENISELAAIEIEDEPLWDGQAKSSRYQNFSPSGCVTPESIRGTEIEGAYQGILRGLVSHYTRCHEPLMRVLKARDPKPEDMQAEEYERVVAARAFDVTRYWLPLAVRTNVGQVVSIRTLEKQIRRLLASPVAELRRIGEEMRAACRRPPVNLWEELCGRPETGGEPLAPTLARHVEPSAYLAGVYDDLARYGREVLAEVGLTDAAAWGEEPEAADGVELIEPHDPLDEVVATLLYRVSHAPYRRILAVVREWPDKRKREALEVAVRRRGPHDELIREFRCGYAFVFDILMDIGGWRDLHRHRRCQQVRQGFTARHGYAVPPLLAEAGLQAEYVKAMDAVKDDLERLRAANPEAARYAIPFGFKVRCLFKMDFAEAEYIVKLRTGVKGHGSYRRVAWAMRERVARRYPALAERMAATPPEEEAALIR